LIQLNSDYKNKGELTMDRFNASFMYKGASAGIIKMGRNGFTFRCQKIMVDNQYKRISVLIKDVETVKERRYLLFFKELVFYMNDGTIYSFVVLNSEKFLNELTTMGLGM
jgi:hypothetical protein